MNCALNPDEPCEACEWRVQCDIFIELEKPSISLERLEELKKNIVDFYYDNHRTLNTGANNKLLNHKDIIGALIYECKNGEKTADPRW